MSPERARWACLTALVSRRSRRKRSTAATTATNAAALRPDEAPVNACLLSEAVRTIGPEVAVAVQVADRVSGGTGLAGLAG